MEDSIFTKIIKGEIPSYKVYENEHVYAFLDIHPIAPGHVLVVPKKQIEFLWDLEDDDYRTLMEVVKEIAVHLRTVLNTPYVGVKVVGVDVPHAHVHLVPFTTVEEFRNRPDMASEPDYEALAALAKKVQMI